MLLFYHIDPFIQSFFFFLIPMEIFYVRGGERSGRKSYLSGSVEVPTSFEEQSVL